MKRPTLVGKALYLASGRRRWPWLLVVGLAVVVSCVEAVGAVLVFGLLGLITDPDGTIQVPVIGDLRTFLGDSGTDEALVAGAIIVAAFFVVRAIVVIGMEYVRARVTQSAGERLAARLHRGYLAMPYVVYVGTNSAKQIRNIQDAVPRVVTDIFVQGARSVSELIIVVVLGTMLTVTSPLAMAMLIVVVGPAVLLVNRFIRPRLQSLGRETQELARRSVQALQETIHGLREVRAHRREAYFSSVFASIRHAWARNKTRRMVLRSLPTTTLETLLVLFIAAFLAVSILTGTAAADVLPVLGMFAYVGFRLKPSLTQVVEGVNAARYSAAAIDDLYDDLRMGEQWLAAGEQEGGTVSFENRIEIDNVVFAYPESPAPALQDIDLVIEHGSSVGFVGPTGGGKSTLLDVIIGLLDPNEGSVRVDGTDIRTARRAWFEKLGVVPQATFLIDATLRSNIALGVRKRDIDETRLARVIALAQLDDFVRELPDGLETMLGERGVRLSGGQRQRVAIARALYEDPEVLVLDEGTAALDNHTEAELMRALHSLRGSITLLIVAHRLTTVRNCDVIHVVERGDVIASGTYDELVRDSSYFKNLAG